MSFPTNTSRHDALALADGSRLRLRPIDSGDRDGVAALFARLSPESRYRRFLSPKSELTPRELSYLTEVDQVHHVAIAAVDESSGSIVGVARYAQVADRARVADVAVVVVDALHGMGIGTALAARTVERAGSNGFAQLTATTLWENRAARALLRRLRFRVQASDCQEIGHLLELNCRARAGQPLTMASRTPTNPKDTDMIASHLTVGIARAWIDEFHRIADARGLAHRRAEPGRTGTAERSATLRLGSPGDEGPLAPLAELDGSTPPARPVLLADVDGQLLAALAHSDGSVAADQFHCDGRSDRPPSCTSPSTPRPPPAEAPRALTRAWARLRAGSGC